MRRRKGKKKIRTGRNQTRKREKSTQRPMDLSEVCILWSRIFHHFNSNFFGSVGPFVCWPIGQSIMLKCEKSHISGERGEAGKEGLTPFVTMP